MSSPDTTPEQCLRRKLLVGHLAYSGVVTLLATTLFFVLFAIHHHDVTEHPREAVLLILAALALIVLQLLGTFWCLAIARRYTSALTDLRQLTDDIAHDLKTPLTRLSTAAELALMNGLPAEELAGTVGAETQGMLHLINTMLEISKTGRGLDRSPRAPLDLADLVRSVADLYQPALEAKGQSLVLDIGAVPSFSGHEAQLRQVVQNLLDNATKFTPVGGEIAVSLASDGKEIALAVKDNGPGVPEKDQAHIFDRFYRADATRTTHGNGLGLALVKAIAVSYGGTATYATRYAGYGAVFTVRLPRTIQRG